MAISTLVVSNTGATTTYSSSGDSAVTFMSICNTIGAAILVDVWLVPVAGLQGNDTLLLKNIEILADDTFILYHGGEKILLENGDQIIVNSNTFESATAITSYTAI